MPQEKKERGTAAAEGNQGVIKVSAVGVTSRWRAGLQFGPEPVAVDCADLTQDQLDAIAADRYLKIDRGEAS